MSPSEDSRKKDYRTAALMSTDIHNYSRILDGNEQAALQVLKEHSKLTSDLTKQYDGKIIKAVGDTILIEFPDTIQAVECAVRIQDLLHELNGEKPEEKRYHLRIGIHLGDIWFFEDDALGEGVTVASRLQNLAKPGRICISDQVFTQIRGKIPSRVLELGKVELPEIGRGIQAYEILTSASLAEEAAGASPPPVPKPAEPPKPSVRPDTDAMKEAILDHIKTEGRHVPLKQIQGIFPRSDKRVASLMEKLTDRGVFTRIEKADGSLEYGISDTRWDSLTEKIPPFTVSVERGEAAEPDEDRPLVSVALRNHIAAFVLVNGFLLFLNIITGSGFGYPWFLYPMMAWGIGLANHIAAAAVKGKQRREKRTKLPKEQRKLLKRLHAHEMGWAGHITSFLSVNAFLFMIYFLHPARFIWPLIPAAGWGIGVIFHWITYAGRKGQLIRKLRKLGVTRALLRAKEPPKSIASAGPGEALPQIDSHSSLVREAERIKNALVVELHSPRHMGSRWESDLEPLLDTYLRQIKDLDSRRMELQKIISGVDIRSLKREIRELLERKEQTDSASLKREYEKSLKIAGQQLRSYDALLNEKELMDLRLKAVVMELKKLQMDFARLTGVSAAPNENARDYIREKSRELSQYLEDLRSSFAELDDEL